MKIKLTKLKQLDGKPIVVTLPKNLPKGFRQAARKAGRDMRRVLEE